MVNLSIPCKSVDTKREKTWLYDQYYIGERDSEKRKSGHGIHHWTGAKSLECYDGHFTCDTMHGAGEYRWRYHDGQPFTYEGYFFNNNMHGYGVMSFPDGRTFRGLFINNTRWGPGIQSHAAMNEDVGLWCGNQLIRLAWKPSTPSITPDFMINAVGKTIVEFHRRLLATKIKVIGKSNSALDLLKECGADPVSAVEKWHKLYPKHCTDIASPMCHVQQFEYDYYEKNTQYKLEEVNQIPYFEDTQTSDTEQNNIYYAWNNNNVTINMMKHSYQHEEQRDQSQIDLSSILSGPRRMFKSAGKHEADCRALLLTSYLGYIVNVAQLINKENVHPNVSDLQGNSALMYATCGDQADVIRFLVEAGANVNAFNDTCCTPLGIALMRYACAINDIPPNSMVQALIPPPVIPTPPIEESKVFEWNIIRDQFGQAITSINRTPSKTGRTASSKKVKSLMSIKDQPVSKRKTDASPIKNPEPLNESDDSLCDYKKVYNDANREYSIKVNDLFISPNADVPYLFDITDMITEIENLEEDSKKIQEKNPKKNMSKVIKDTFKTSKVLISQSKDRIDHMSENSLQKFRSDMLSKMKLTILELLANGAKPTLVCCPQPALVIAISCNSPDLIKHLVQYGADVNELYPRLRGYSPLDIAVSRQFTWENLEIIRALLENGANANRSIHCEDDSSDITVTAIRILAPTLLHAVIARKVEIENEEEIRRHLIDLLLDYNCNPLSQFKGRSAIDVAMTKNISLFDVFVRNRKTNLNCVINDTNQSVLVKMFSIPFFKSIGAERIQILIDLLVYGADPLLSCKNGQDKYQNIFVFAKKTLSEMENGPQEKMKKEDVKKPEKPKKDEKLSTKSIGRMVTDDKEDYKQAIELVTECARLVHIRWLQGQLSKNLIETIYKYRHRQWNMILNECKNKKAIGLWLTPHRGIEIWNIFNSTKKKIYTDERVLKHFLCIVTFLAWRFYNPKKNDFTPWSKVTTIVKDLIEKDVLYLLKENNSINKTIEDIPWKCSFVKPELDRAEKKFKICFECALPLNENKLTCNICKMISFCSLECLKENVGRANCHPCSNDLILKHFPSLD
ncbi:ankyrin repeat and MYND domain-containing protein 1-like [Pieris napi]|uniref:ankyrin repeat and MYND domain-containing protein 1-like n=1 Tax=Pieris napi TaxID=78633 RepID=UPI001FBBFBF4|nr:ankyrin repeat and MYND domain-containing protein 1-like [Pieris napi]